MYLSKHLIGKIEDTLKRFDSSFYFYDLDALKAHLEIVSSELDPNIKLWYACKANPMSAVLKVLRNMKFGVDVASSGELHQVMNAGIRGENIIATGPGKSKEYLHHLLVNNVQTIVLESTNQLAWLDEVSEKLGQKTNALVRIQLDWKEGKSVLGGGAITPFGLGIKDWESVDFSKFKHVNIKGFHVFQWGNIMETSKLNEIWSKTVEDILSFAKAKNLSTEIIDLGGGLGVPYDLTSTGIKFSEVHEILKSVKEKYQLQTIWMELGRYTVAECGYYITKIIDIKNVRGKKLVVTEGGINHAARVALTNQAFPCHALYQSAEDKTEEYQVHGPLCTALDHLGTFDLPANLQIGDRLVFNKAGAYGFTESMPYFLCHELPAEVISYNGDLMIPRPPKTAYDWMI